ncbi:MAG TPA: threonine/serine dehydratase [bacterium]|nr:threonine/serine dehydratase [bacterium]
METTALTISLADIYAARERIAPYVHRTPLLPMPGGIYLKCENLQVTGAFKARGAFNHVLALRHECERGIVTASSGNHGNAVAHVAKTLGLRAVVVVPEDVVAAKADAITDSGAELIRFGRYSEQRVPHAKEISERRGLHYVPPYDDPLIIAGQGTAGLELVEQFLHVETVAVPVSGGGLISGIAIAVKELRPQAKVIGVEPERARRFAQSRAAGRPVVLEKAETIADGLRVLTPGALTWQVTSRYVDEFVGISDHEIETAMRRILLDAHVLAEPSGAAAAAWTFLAPHPSPVAVLSGGNASPDLLSRLLA